MNQIRIGFDAKRAFHNSRGLGNYSRTLIEGIVDYVPEVDPVLYTPEFDQSNSPGAYLESLNRVQMRMPHGKWAYLPSPLWRSWGIKEDIAHDKVDLFHGLSHEIPFSSEKLGCKIVVTIHDLIFMRYPEFFPWIDRRVYKQKFKYSAENADLIIAICEQTKEDLIRYLDADEKKIVVCYQAIHPQYYEPWNEEAIEIWRQHYNLYDPYILYVGAFEKRKNVINLIHAFARLQDYPGKLVLIGKGSDYLDKMISLIDHYKIKDKVKILQDVPMDQLPGFYQKADVFCYPAIFEGFGLPILESLFSGTPVVTSEGSCFPESAGGGALYTDPYSVEDLHRNLDLVLTDPSIANRLIKDGAEHIKQFSLAETSQKLWDAYQLVLN